MRGGIKTFYLVSNEIREFCKYYKAFDIPKHYMHIVKASGVLYCIAQHYNGIYFNHLWIDNNDFKVYYRFQKALIYCIYNTL